MAGKMYLVRHGDYDRGPERLSQEGIKQSNDAAESLRERGLGSKAVVLSSSAPRAVQTAGIIAEGLGTPRSYVSDTLNAGGNHHLAVQSISWLIKTAFEVDNGGTPDYGDGLVVVTHLPLLAAVTGRRRFENGEVAAYDSGDWINPDFSAFEQRAQMPWLSESESA